MEFSKKDFGDDFHWGVSTAAYQIEGAYEKDGKGASIWDEFVKRPGKIHMKQDGRIACDFYHRYEADLELMKQMSIPNHRFSISWSRLIPEGTGRVNRKGIDFYNRVIDKSLSLGIEPWVTLYHWDLPQELQNEGGWVNRDVISWFSNYVHTCAKYFGDRVKNWMVLNEPMVFTGAGYFLGVHAPGKKGPKNFLAAVHHAAICQAEGGRILKNMNPQFQVGTTFSCSHVEPWRTNKKDLLAAQRADLFLNRLFVEPLLGLGYPAEQLKILRRLEHYFRPGDEERLKFDMDFIGIQNYTREIIRHSKYIPYANARIIKADKRKVETTLMNWEVYPPSIYQMLKKFSAYPNIPPMIITENGAAFRDEMVNKEINDSSRKKYLQDYIMQVLKAKQEGVNVKGYFAWTFMDNFEWAEGYYPAFGLVHVDFKTQERIIKSSGHWYREFLKS